jgi:hypothetical protein
MRSFSATARAGRWWIWQRVLGYHQSLNGITSPALRTRHHLPAVTANSGRMTKDGGGFNLRAGWSDAGQAVEKRIRKQGGRLIRSAARRWGSAMVAGGIAFAHIRTIPVVMSPL